MRPRTAIAGFCVALATVCAAGARPGAGPLPPGRQHRLTIEGQNTVTFVPQAGLDPFRIAYEAQVEYIVNTRKGPEAATQRENPTRKKTARKATAAAARAARNPGDEPAAKVASAVDLSIHSSRMKFQQNGQTVVESRASRSRFQGRFQPDSPVLSVTSSDAPPRLQELMRSFDTTAATLLLNDEAKVIDRKVRTDGPLRALIETLLSIHTPIPRGVAYWEAPTQLAMGHGQTARGTLRFEKQKESLAATGGAVNVKVSGVLKAEGTVVGRFIKDGTYTVSGEQTYDPTSREWTSARWSVVVDNELASPAGQTVARARGTMTVQSRSLDDAPAADPADGKP